VRILLATDADWIVDAVTAALGGPDTSFTVAREGRLVAGVVADRAERGDVSPFDVAIFDLQIGSMGGMATTMSLRLDESAGVIPHVPVLMLLDREADVHLARRSGAEGWLVKPLDALRLRKAARAVAAGLAYHNGVRPGPAQSEPPVTDGDEPDGGSLAEAEASDSAEEEPATAG
jgi:DNA-binding response OmpR family regulator